jgi:hypothetical protein
MRLRPSDPLQDEYPDRQFFSLPVCGKVWGLSLVWMKKNPVISNDKPGFLGVFFKGK